MENAAIRVEAWRANRVECMQQVVGSVVDSNGKAVAVWGDPDFAMWGRSTVKPLQALPIIIHGAAEHFKVSHEELALASASHTGAIIHTKRVAAWLQRMGLDSSALQCGCHAPEDEAAHAQLLRDGKPFCALHNNCSGKHTGMLCNGLHQGFDLTNYLDADHPVQIQARQAIEVCCDVTLTEHAIDGCSIPTYWLPLKNLAQGMVRLGTGVGLPEDYQSAGQRIYQAFVSHPELTCGEDDPCHLMMQACQQKALVKMGADGLIAGCVPELGLGFGFKALDGGYRAVEVVAASWLQQTGILSVAHQELYRPVLKNRNQLEVGFVRAVF